MDVTEALLSLCPERTSLGTGAAGVLVLTRNEHEQPVQRFVPVCLSAEQVFNA